MMMPELYDNVYSRDHPRALDYYTTNRVYRLGEYAIHSLAENYKYGVLPHYLVRGGQDEFRVLDILRRLRLAYFFDLAEFVDLVNEYIESMGVITCFVNSN